MWYVCHMDSSGGSGSDMHNAASSRRLRCVVRLMHRAVLFRCVHTVRRRHCAGVTFNALHNASCPEFPSISKT